MSDFSAVVREEQDNLIAGKHGLGIRKNRSERLVNICK